VIVFTNDPTTKLQATALHLAHKHSAPNDIPAADRS
jgi:hypothetical protein